MLLPWVINAPKPGPGSRSRGGGGASADDSGVNSGYFRRVEVEKDRDPEGEDLWRSSFMTCGACSFNLSSFLII